MPRFAILFFVLTFTIASSALGQNVITFQPQKAVPAGSSIAITEPTQLHITDRLIESEEGRESLRQFQELKQAGLLNQRAASKTERQLGTQEIFKVFNLKTEIRDNIDFTLKDTSERFNIWVETAELNNGNVRDQEVADLKAALATQTPAGSYNPSAGIIVNDEIVFGDPPNLDGDSKTDILMVDVRDDFDPENGKNLYVGGFFDPGDLTATGNNKDIVYLDTTPSIVASNGTRNSIDGLLGTAAHEYQHLIHANYDSNESTFVNEAQSEWAEMMNGFKGRSMAFLSSLTEHGTAFFVYRSDILTDRERGQLFTLYVAEQLGVDVAGSITRQVNNDEVGYEDAVGSLETLHNVVNDFLTANLLNDKSVDPRFGYSNPFVNNKRTIVDETIDGRTSTELAEKTIALSHGAVHYTRIRNVTDATINVDASTIGNLEEARGRLGIRILTKQGSAPYSFMDVVPSGDPVMLDGIYDEIVLIITHKAVATGSIKANAKYSATWTEETNTFVESVSFDNGSASGDYFVFTDLNGIMVQTTRFERPDYNGVVALDEVQVAPFFFSQFGQSPQGSPRDFTLLVLGETGGLPDLDKTLFSTEVTDSRSFSSVTNATAPFNFLSIDLTSFANELGNLPDVFHIGLAEAGTDDNYLVLAPSTYSAENLSYIGDESDNSWGALWDQEVGNPPTAMTNRVFPIRATFLINEIVGVEDEASEETTFDLRQNYPNPFAGITTVEFRNPRAADIDIEVFDLLGRKVATLVNGLYPAGKHSITLNASNWASGLYLYRMRSGDVSLTRTLTVAN